jgi:ABC-type antimicrobial peptide transport system permease subunit
LVNLLKNNFGEIQYLSLVSGEYNKEMNSSIFYNLASTITTIEKIVLVIIIVMTGMIAMLVSVIIIDNSKKLAATMKALGYRDHKNILVFLSIYIPVFLLAVGISIPLSILILHVFDMIIFNGMGLMLLNSFNIINFAISTTSVIGIFGISGVIGYIMLKRDKLIDRIKE